jgi:hypothetical protein
VIGDGADAFGGGEVEVHGAGGWRFREGAGGILR